MSRQISPAHRNFLYHGRGSRRNPDAVGVKAKKKLFILLPNLSGIFPMRSYLNFENIILLSIIFYFGNRIIEIFLKKQILSLIYF